MSYIKFDVSGCLIYCGNINDNHKISHNNVNTSYFTLCFLIFSHRLAEVKVKLSQTRVDHCRWQGITECQNGDVPIYVKRPAIITAGGRREAEEWR